MYYFSYLISRKIYLCRQLRNVPRRFTSREHRIILQTILLTDQYLPNFIMNWHAIPPRRVSRRSCIVSLLFRGLTRPWTINLVELRVQAYHRTFPISIKNFDFKRNPISQLLLYIYIYVYNFLVYLARRKALFHRINRALGARVGSALKLI